MKLGYSQENTYPNFTNKEGRIGLTLSAVTVFIFDFLILQSPNNLVP